MDKAKGASIKRYKIDYRCLLPNLGCFTFLKNNSLLLKPNPYIYDIDVELRNLKKCLISDWISSLTFQIYDEINRKLIDYFDDIPHNDGSYKDGYIRGEYFYYGEDELTSFDFEININQKENIVVFSVEGTGIIKGKESFDLAPYLLEKIQYILESEGCDDSSEYFPNLNEEKHLDLMKLSNKTQDGNYVFELEVDFDNYDCKEFKDLPEYIYKIMVTNKDYREYLEDSTNYNVSKKMMSKVKAITKNIKKITEAEIQNETFLIKLIEEIGLDTLKMKELLPIIINELNNSELIQLTIVQQYAPSIKFIDNPSELVQLATIQNFARDIQYIKNPTEAVKLALVKYHGNGIQYIDNPSEEVQLNAVKNNGLSIDYIENPSEEVQLAAVQQGGYAIQYIKNPSEAVQLAAVKQKGWLIDYIDNPSEAVKRTAKKRN